MNYIAPEVTTLVARPPAPWISPEIKSAIIERDTIHDQLKIDENSTLREIYKEKKNKVRSSMFKSKIEYFQGEYQKSHKDIKRTWKVTKSLIPDKTKSQKCNFEDIGKKAEEFNDYFSKVGKEAYEKTQRSVRTPVTFNTESRSRNVLGNKFRPKPVSVDTIILIVKDLRETSSVGIDGISLRFVKDSLPIMALYYTIVVNTSIVTGKFPRLWKHPLIAPVYKTGNEDEVGNYRPIALLPILSKILEKVISIQLMEYLESYNLLSNTQHGFRVNLSTETALMRVTDAIYENIDNNLITLVILCDLSKAFDSVCHSILLQKLNLLNVDEF